METRKKDWREAYTALCSGKYLGNVLDTVIFDQIQANRPLMWVRTGADGRVNGRDLRSLTVTEVLQEVYSLTTPQNIHTGPRYTPLPESSLNLAMAIVTSTNRPVLTRTLLLQIPSFYSSGLQGLTLLRTPRTNFDPRVFIYQRIIDLATFTVDDSVRIRVRDVLQNHLTGLYPEPVAMQMVRSESEKLVLYLEKQFGRKIRTVTVSFRLEINTEKLFLLGIEEMEIVLMDKKHKKTEKISPNVISIDLKPKITPSDASQTFDFMQKRTISTDFTSQIPLFSSTNSQKLRTNSSFSLPEMSFFDTNVQKHEINSRFTRNSPQKVTLKEDFHTNKICTGKFCALKHIKYMNFPNFSRNSRFLIPVFAIKLSKKREFNPLYYPFLLHFRPDLEVNMQENEEKVGVCLRCYFVYRNILHFYHKISTF